MIKVMDLHKAFDRHEVLRGVDLQCLKGEITVIIGRSGGGKSVLLKHVIGLIKPDTGRVVVDDQDITQMGEYRLNQVRRKMGMLFQDAALFDSMTVGDNVAFPLYEHTRLTRRQTREVVAEKLRLVGLSGIEDQNPANLSGGMRKRVGLARAIALDPEILLFDEPTTGLDPIMCDAINRLIKETQAQLGVTTLVISHDIHGAYQIADHIAMLYEGQIIAQGSPAEIQASDNPYVQQFIHGRAEGPIQVV
jgi:phospholipid/cholesterol/gamma-HCH transport system ATP-binding protein